MLIFENAQILLEDEANQDHGPASIQDYTILPTLGTNTIIFTGEKFQD